MDKVECLHPYWLQCKELSALQELDLNELDTNNGPLFKWAYRIIENWFPILIWFIIIHNMALHLGSTLQLRVSTHFTNNNSQFWPKSIDYSQHTCKIAPFPNKINSLVISQEKCVCVCVCVKQREMGRESGTQTPSSPNSPCLGLVYARISAIDSDNHWRLNLKLSRWPQMKP